MKAARIRTFDESRISDQKRLVRGEHLLLARSILRARDEQHNAKWKALVLSGGSPSGEIAAIRELMPRARVIAADTDASCLEKAIDAGADDVLHADVCEVGDDREVPSVITKHGPFDLVDLDFCGQVTRRMERALRAWMGSTGAMSNHSVFMLTFSYGRDVSEMFHEALRVRGRGWSIALQGGYGHGETSLEYSLPDEIPDNVAGRLIYLFSGTQLSWLKSVAMYRGAEMPMCSLLFQVRSHRKDRCKGGISILRVEPGDFELAVSYPDAAKLYDCPQARIESLRRRYAAIKAGLTRNEQKRTTLFDLQADEVDANASR